MHVSGLSEKLEEETRKAQAGEADTSPDFIDAEDGVIPALQNLLSAVNGSDEDEDAKPKPSELLVSMLKTAAETLVTGLREYVTAAEGKLVDEEEAHLARHKAFLAGIKLGEDEESAGAKEDGAAEAGAKEDGADKEGDAEEADE